MPAQISQKRRQKILDGLSEGLSLTGACRNAGVGTSAPREWRDPKSPRYDEAFALAAEAAIEDGTDLLEDEAKKRAFDGSDVLTIFLLKGRRPQKYRDNVKVENVGKDDGPIEVEHKGVSLSNVLELARRTGAVPPPSSD